jgi:hypothetical protein
MQIQVGTELTRCFAVHDRLESDVTPHGHRRHDERPRNAPTSQDFSCAAALGQHKSRFRLTNTGLCPAIIS